MGGVGGAGWAGLSFMAEVITESQGQKHIPDWEIFSLVNSKEWQHVPRGFDGRI